MGTEEVRPPGGQGLGDLGLGSHQVLSLGAEDRAGCPSQSATALEETSGRRL